MVALGKAKRNDEKFCNLILVVGAIMIIGYLAGWIASPPTLLLMELFF